ncbi:MAG TPA: hypothetical protein HPQ00_16020, partial [Magnetococcales bacterium]|nr:hypothetical protein [Magnetococcales bacterium]
MKSSDTSRSTGPRQRLSASLDRQEGARSARDRTLIIAPPAAVVYLKKLIRHLSLPGDFTLVDHHLSTPGEFMVQANQHHQHSGPFRRIFALLDLPEGEPAFKQFYKGVREQIRYHDIGGSCLFRALFSRPDFSLWQSLH